MNASRSLAADYSRRAAEYARYWAPVIHPMAQPLFDAMPLAHARKILDVGTGTGALWPMIGSAAPEAELYGLDGAEGMLRAGGTLLRGRVAVMDAVQLAVRGGTFDVVLLLYVLFHVSDPIAALHEIRAALRPHGVAGIVVWGEDPGLPGGGIWAEELERAGAAPDPRDPSVMQQTLMNTPAKLTDLLQRAGFAVDRVWSQRFVHEWSVDKLLATQTRCGVPSRRLESLGADAQRACSNRVRARLEQLSADELTYRVEIIYGITRRK